MSCGNGFRSRAGRPPRRQVLCPTHSADADCAENGHPGMTGTPASQRPGNEYRYCEHCSAGEERRIERKRHPCPSSGFMRVHPTLPDPGQEASMSRSRRTDLPETNWAASALCADMPAEIFDAAGDRVQTAKAACAHCPVTRQCLRWAISHEVEDEIWGARTPRERRRLSMAFVLEPPSTAASVTDKRSARRGTDPGGCAGGIRGVAPEAHPPLRPQHPLTVPRGTSHRASPHRPYGYPRRAPRRRPNAEPRPATNDTADSAKRPVSTADGRSGPPRKTAPPATRPVSPSRPEPK